MPEDVAENCIRLINDHSPRLALSKRGQVVVHREFSYQEFAGIVHGEVERALGDRFGGTSSLSDPCLS